MRIPDHSKEFETRTLSARNLLLVLAAIMGATIVFPMPGLGGIAGYAPLHMFMETIAVVTASMIYAIGWHASHTKPDYRRLAIACLFLGVAFLDFSHILSFNGMPDLVTPAGPEKTINFWLAARTFSAVGFICLVFLPHTAPGKTIRHLMLAAVLVSVSLIHVWFLYFPDTVPATYAEPDGLTRFKIVFEYGLLLTFLSMAFLLWRQSRIESRVDLLLLAVSAATMGLSEIFFTVYTVMNDVYALLGHVYKIIAYSLLYRALVLTGLEAPFKEVANLNSRVKATLDALPDMMFEISEDGTIRQYHSNISEPDLLAPPHIFLGKNMGEFVPGNVMEVIQGAIADINEYGRSNARQYSLITKKGVRRYELSGSGLTSLEGDARYILVVRDVTERHMSLQRTEILLSLASDALSMDEKQLATKALDNLEEMTHSRVALLHMVAEDQQTIELLAWSSETARNNDSAKFPIRDSVSGAVPWADCVREGRQVIVSNDITDKKDSGAPEERLELKRFISIPVFDNNKVRMIVSVGNSDYNYDADMANTVQLIGNELYQIIQRRRAQRENERSQRILKTALDHLPIGVAINSVGNEIRFEYMNDNFPAFYRTTREALIATPDFWQVVYEDPDQREHMRRRVVEGYNTCDPDKMRWDEVPVPKAGQELRYISAQNVQVPEEGLAVSLVIDITERRKAEIESKIAATAFSSQEGIMITDANKKILRVNKSFERMTGYSQEEAKGKDPSFFSSGVHGKEFYTEMWKSIFSDGGWRGEIWNKRKNGEVYPQSLTITAVKDAEGKIINYVGDFIDISDLKNAENKISRLSYYDSLTGLPNRVQLRNLVDSSIKHASGKKSLGALSIIDLDHFKTLNDTMGHEAGDYLLVLVADRLRRLLSINDHVARYGGDEFVLVFNDLGSDSTEAAGSIKQKLLYVMAALEDNYDINGGNYYTTCSVGVTLFGTSETTASKLLKQADIALSQAKDGGRNQVSFFDPELESAVSERAKLLADLREGIRLQQFELYLQSQQDVSGVVIGAEALVRWNHPHRGLVSPADFIPLAEASGLMLPLGREIMRMGLDLIKDWQQRDYFRDLKLSLNLAAQQFYAEDFSEVLIKEIDTHQLDAGKLMLEFTESTLLDNFSQARLNIHRLSSRGVKFAIDDFGTGYSSLAYLSELPVDQLKIDQSFVRNMATRSKDKAIVRTIIDMAYSLGMEVIAEGVETHEQRDYLLAQGCMFYQGYLIGRPESVKDFNERIVTRQSLSEL